MSTHSSLSAASTPVWHRALAVCAIVGVLLFGSMSALRSVTVSHGPHALHTSQVHLFHAATPVDAAPVRLHRVASAHGFHAGHSMRSGYWHTEGNRIVTERGTPVRISGLNWSGFETTAGVPGGLRYQDYHTILREVASSGYNTLRIPFSNQMVEQPTIPTDIAFENEQGSINSDLEGLDSMQILDHIVAAAGQLGLKVILDDHRSEAGSSAEQSGLWYTAQYPEQAWTADWVTLARHFHSNTTVIGFDLRNEPHNAGTSGACWSCGGARDWHLAAERAGNAILHENANLLIFVEGVDQYEETNSFWGGDLAGVRTAPVRLIVPGRVVYSPHVYGPSEYQQPWFNGQTTPASLIAKYRRNWAYISESGMAPVWIGEFGAPKDAASLDSTEPGSEGQWFHTLVNYLAQHNEIGWTYWSLNGEDRYGMLDAAYRVDPASATAAVMAGIRIPQPLVPATEEATTGVAHSSLSGHFSRLQQVRFHLGKFPFHLLPKASHREDGPEIVVAYDKPKAEVAPVMPKRLGLVEVAEPMTVQPVAARAALVTSDEGMPRRARVQAKAAKTSSAVAEQIRRDTESALEHLPPVAE